MKALTVTVGRNLHPLLLGSWLLLLLSIGCAPGRQTLPPRSTASVAYTHVSLGLCEDYPEESRSLSLARRDLQVLATNDLRVLRIAFGWDAMEPEPGKYDWSFWDDFVRMATDEYGIRLIPYVCYTPRWASASQGEDFWQQPPTNTAPFAEFMKQLVSRYKDRIHSWEIWNEPDNPAYWGGTVEQFADLLAAGSRAVRQVDPSAKVVLGGLAWNLNFLEAVLTNSAAIQNVDIINLHNYYETWSSDPLENLPAYVGRAADILQLHGQDKPIWMAEVGYSSFRDGAFVSGQYQAGFRHEHTPEAQAASVFRVMTLLLASGKVSLAAWYRVNDLPGTQEVIGDVNNRHLGILDQHGHPKPALRALKYFQSLFAERFRCIDQEVRLTREIGAPVEVHAFEKRDGEVVVVGWLKTYVPGTREGPVSGNAIDKRQATISLSFPAPLASSGEAYNELGDHRGTLRLQQQRRTTHLPNVKLRDGRITVLVLKTSGALLRRTSTIEHRIEH
jgi:hypothetical protein